MFYVFVLENESFALLIGNTNIWSICRYAQYVHTFHAYRPTYARGNTLVTVKWGKFRLRIVFFCVFLRYLCQFLFYKKTKNRMASFVFSRFNH